MRKFSFIVTGLIVAAAAVLTLRGFVGTADAAPEKERPRCEFCNMFWDISTTRIEASIKSGGKTGTHRYESLGCLYQSVGAGDSLVSVKVVDYTTASGKSPKMIDAKKAQYLYDTERLKGSMAPFIAAFATKDAAGKAKAELGGSYMTWEDTWTKLGSKLNKKTAAAASPAKSGAACPCCVGKEKK